MRTTTGTALLAPLFIASLASAQWVNYVNETATRLVASPSLVVGDNLEKDFHWGDFDQDGDIDIICVRKFPGSIQGGFRNILFMNESGVLVDRTVELGSAADVAGSQGLLDPTNDRDVKAVDVDNDGWLDLVTATTMSDQVDTMLGQPRVYRNLGLDKAGNWRGFRFEDGRIPALFAMNGSAANPRFCEAAVGDFTGDGYIDIFFTDYDTPETSGTVCIDLNSDGDTNDAGECQQSPGETASRDFNNKFLVNEGAANPGFFVDTTTTRMTAVQLDSAFGNSAFGADINHDGHLDVVRVNTLTGGQNVAAIYANPANLGNTFNGPTQLVAGAPYFIDYGDLNNDGRLDILVVDDGQDKVLINTGNNATGQAQFTAYTIADSLSEFGNTTRIADLDNDGLLDAIITDVDADLPTFCPDTGRRTHIYKNTGIVGTGLLDEPGLLLPLASQSALFDVAVVDIDQNGWLDLVIGRCGGIEVFMNRPPVSIEFSYPNGLPSSLNPETANGFDVDVAILGGGSIVADTAKLYVSTDGATWNSFPMSQLDADTYRAEFPAVSCGAPVRFYVGATLSNGGPIFDPSAAPTIFRSVPVQTGETVLVSESFEGDVSGWTIENTAVTFGPWVAAAPVGTAQGGLPASPAADATPGSGVRCFQTGLGVAGGVASSQDLDGGPTVLTSPAFDLSGVSAAQLSMAVWFFCDDILTTPTQADQLRIEVSNGGDWVLMEAIRENITSWTTKTYNLGQYVELNSTVRVRVIANDNPNNSVTEAAIDDFVISVAECDAAEPCSGDYDADGSVGGGDLATLLSNWGAAAGDLDGDGIVGGSDLATLLSNWGACP
ncbi:MAG: hypothetical protein RI967_2199 [Planctomycetota bacterium]